MSLGPSEFERIRRALAEADVEEPLTAREIKSALEERGVDVESPHRVATVLGRQARRGDVEVIEDRPYRYRIHGDEGGRREGRGRDGGHRDGGPREDRTDRPHTDGGTPLGNDPRGTR